MTTNARIEAEIATEAASLRAGLLGMPNQSLTDEQVLYLANHIARNRIQRDAATAKALRIEDATVAALTSAYDAQGDELEALKARHRVLVEAVRALLRLVQQGKYRAKDVEAAQAALKGEEEAIG